MEGIAPPREIACVDIMAAAVDPVVIPEAVKPRKLIRLEVRHGVATAEDNITVADFIENCVFGVKYQVASTIFWNPPKHVQLSSLTLSCGEVLLAGHSTMVPSPMQ